MHLIIICPLYSQFANYLRYRFPYVSPNDKIFIWLGKEEDIDRTRGLVRGQLCYVLDGRVSQQIIDYCRARHFVFITIEERP